jgi:DNA-binding CsgD family transcriptional regulator
MHALYILIVLIAGISWMSRLTVREKEVLALIGRMMNCRRIAAALRISEFTVRKHRANILRKLSLRTTAQLTAHAIASARVEMPSAVFRQGLASCGRARSRSWAWSATD